MDGRTDGNMKAETETETGTEVEQRETDEEIRQEWRHV